jgi:hypothetical protein
MARPPALVLFAPAPGRASPVAGYLEALLPELARRAELTLVVAEADRTARLAGIEVLPFSAYPRAPALQDRPHVFELADHPSHAHVLRGATARPGLLVLHDLSVLGLMEAETLGAGDTVSHLAAMAWDHGLAGRRLAALRAQGYGGGAQAALTPLHQRVAGAARAVLAPSRWVADRLRATVATPIRQAPPHPPAGPAPGRAEARRRLDLPGEAPVLLAPATQPATALLEALAALPAARPLLLGEGDAALALRLAEAGLAARVRLVPEEEAAVAVAAADLLLDLRIPGVGGTTALLARALGAGLPAVVWEGGPADIAPPGVLVRLAPGTRPDAAIEALLGDDAARAAIGVAGRDWASLTTPADTAAAYLELVAGFPPG